MWLHYNQLSFWAKRSRVKTSISERLNIGEGVGDWGRVQEREAAYLKKTQESCGG